MSEEQSRLRSGDGLLVVDVQRDFCPGGKLAIEGGDQVVGPLNRWLAAAREAGAPIYVSRDWHPPRHVSFEAQGGDWPPHCLQDSEGAEFHPDLDLDGTEVIVTKGVRLDQDQNSVFDQTGFADQLRRDEVKRLWVGGLAQDVCVLATVLDGRKEGFDIRVLARATRPVTREGGEEALDRMQASGAVVIDD